MSHSVLLRIALFVCLAGPIAGHAQEGDLVKEYPLAWASHMAGSTHEITYNRQGALALWLTGPHYDQIAKITLDGEARFFPMGKESAPHGIAFDAAGNLWLTFEGTGFIARVDHEGTIVQQIDVRLYTKDVKAPINPSPHGLAIGPDGKTIWFTGKKSNTVGKINPDGSVEHFELPTVGAVPIYIQAGPDGNMWCTELVGNKIARISPQGVIAEFAIPTANSRPIVIVPGPDGNAMWFSEEASHKVARIGFDGTITEWPVPQTQKNMLLAGLVFDRAGHLWTQSYVNPGNASPDGADFLIKIDKAIRHAADGDISRLPITHYQVPSRKTVLHRIIVGPDDALWFTELNTDKVGRVGQ